MIDASTSAGVMLKLYELRTESALRQARAWFAFEFHPTSARDVLRFERRQNIRTISPMWSGSSCQCQTQTTASRSSSAT